MKLTGALLCFLFVATYSHAGNPHKTDSLLQVLRKASDKDKPALYNLLSKEAGNSDIVKSEEYARKALDMGSAFQDKKGIGDAYNNLGRISYFKGDYATAIDNYMKSFLLRQQLGDSADMANSLSNIGVMYRKMNDYENALEYYMQALALKEKLGKKSEVLNVLNNIGGLYYYQLNTNKAMEYYNRTLSMAIELKDSNLIAATYNNLSLINDDKGKFKEALEQANLTLEIRKKLYDLAGQAAALNNVGRIYEHLGDEKKALEYYSASLKVMDETGDLPGAANTLYNIGGIYLKQKAYQKAIVYFDSSLALARAYRQRLQIRDDFHGLAHAWHYAGNADKSFNYFKQYIEMNDSIYSEQGLEKISEKEAKYQSERKARDIEMLKRDNELKDLKQENEHKRQIVIVWSFVGGLLIALLTVFFLLNRNKIRKKANEKLQASHNEIVKQKRIVEEKQKEIVDSINYAKRIQKAILPHSNLIKQYFTESFVVFKPKDIVSGDFYWLTETEHFYFYATVDCTGHGVPGGFMSMLGNSLLNEIIIEKSVYEPARILDLLREKIIASLKQTGDSGKSKDGMDMVLCRVKKDKSELVYAAANNPLWIIRNGNLLEYKADKQPVGISVTELKPFSQTAVGLEKGDSIYTFTDGYADQFGGPKGKKFKYKQLAEMLVSLHQMPCAGQKEQIEKRFEEWKGQLEQIDDVLVIGVRI